MSASLTVSGDVFNFLTARTDQGFILDQPAIAEEPLETPGVDGLRWRSTGLQHGRFTMTTLTACTTFAEAITKAKSFRKAKGKNGKLTLTASTTSHLFSNIHIEDVHPVPAIGTVVGGGAAANTAAHVVATWVLVPTNFSASDSVNA